MTLSAPPEQTLREPLDRPVEPPPRKIANRRGTSPDLNLTAPDVAVALVAAP